jgi:hypothetical protein
MELVFLGHVLYRSCLELHHLLDMGNGQIVSNQGCSDPQNRFHYPLYLSHTVAAFDRRPEFCRE